jgi:hypothetical protein
MYFSLARPPITVGLSPPFPPDSLIFPGKIYHTNPPLSIIYELIDNKIADIYNGGKVKLVGSSDGRSAKEVRLLRLPV